MMQETNVWVAFPSRNPERAKAANSLWQKRGYKTAIWMEPGMETVGADYNLNDKFPGYWLACNKMVLDITNDSARNRTVVIAADDMHPDPNKSPEDIEHEIYEKYTDGYCVMQPTGDDKNGMDGVWRICGSPWFGIGWIKEAFEGRGPCPLPPFAFYGDEALFEIAKAQGVLWQRNDLNQFHDHWCRTDKFKTKRLDYQKTNSDLFWDKDKAWFMDQKEKGWPGSGRHQLKGEFLPK